MTVAIPAWTLGVIPPVDAIDPTSPARSPYTVSLEDLTVRFATSPERRAIIEGFLNYRAAIHALGYVDGFQWLDGSFSEDVEMLESRQPKDIDVVTFNHDVVLPPGADQSALLHSNAKANFKVDAYWVELDLLPAPLLVSQSAYWYSMWSHRRSQQWKGFLQIDLAPHTDWAARSRLDQIRATLGVTV